MDNFQQELAACREYAQRGKKLADESFNALREVIRVQRNNLIDANRQQQNSRLDNDSIFNDQIRRIEQLESEIQNGINKLNERREDFSIVLYGRTETGKSTLMEILTRGNGESIGKGAQRTTQNVRGYDWNGLRIYDTPGIAAFGEGGYQDNTKAIEAANNADLAIFMISDDGVQYEEAMRLQELMKRGKPVIGIFNVKQAITPERANAKRKIDLKLVEKKLNDTARIDAIVEQFRDFDRASFKNIPFVCAHLQSAFFSQREDDPSLFELSNFGKVEQFILDKVSNDGKFFRFKTFVDAVARPMDRTIATFYDHADESFNTYMDWISTFNDFLDWRDDNFIPYIDSELDTFMSNLRSQFNSMMEDFVDEHYDSSTDYARSSWKRCMDRLDIEGQCKTFVSKLSDYAIRQMRRFNDRLKDRYTGSSFNAAAVAPEIPPLYWTDLTDYGDGLRTGALALALINPFAAIGVGLVSFLFESRSDKIRKKKNQMREELGKSRNEMMPKIRSQLVDIINEGIFGKQLNEFGSRLDERINILGSSSESQEKVADNINSKYKNLNFELLIEALRYVENSRGLGSIMASRLFGEEFVVFSTSGMLDWVRDELMTRGLLDKKVSAYEVDDDTFFDDVKNVVRNGNFSKALRQQILSSPSGEVN